MKTIKSFFSAGKRPIILESREAYKLWSQSYDDEKNNLILYYDEIILKKLLFEINLNGKTLLDFGSGTGRNWKEYSNYNTGRIIGCDTSPEMINKLKNKYPNAETYLITKGDFNFLHAKECDIIISTLVISHINDLKKLIFEWNRVMKDSGDIIITDFHPDLFEKGGGRTFKHSGNTYKIVNYIHKIREMEELFSSFGYHRVSLIEEIIDEHVKSFYLKKNALHIYEKFKGIPFIYGLHLSR